MLKHPDNRTWIGSTCVFASDSNRCFGHLEGLDCDCVKSCSGGNRLSGRKRAPSYGGPTRPCRRRSPKEGSAPSVDTAVAVAVAVAVRFVCEGDVHSDLSVNERGGLDTHE